MHAFMKDKVNMKLEGRMDDLFDNIDPHYNE